MPSNAQLPTYTAPDIKTKLINAGASGTIYSLIVPESEAAHSMVLDGGDSEIILSTAKENWLWKFAGRIPTAAESSDFLDQLGSGLSEKNQAYID